MANWTYLRASIPTAADADEAGALLRGRNAVPSIWFALFEFANLTSRRIRTTDSQGNPTDDLIVPMLVVDRDAALQSLADRRANLKRVLPTNVHSHLAEFERYISGSGASTFALDPADLIFSLAEDDLIESFRVSIEACDVLEPTALQELFDRSHLSFDATTLTVSFGQSDELVRSAPFLPVPLEAIAPPKDVGIELFGSPLDGCRLSWTM